MNETIKDILREMREQRQFLGAELCAWADRIEAAAKRQTMLCLSACSCDLLAKMENENAKLKAALKPVLDIVMDDATSDLSMELAITEAKRIYKEGVCHEKHR